MRCSCHTCIVRNTPTNLTQGSLFVQSLPAHLSVKNSCRSRVMQDSSFAEQFLPVTLVFPTLCSASIYGAVPLVLQARCHHTHPSIVSHQHPRSAGLSWPILVYFDGQDHCYWAIVAAIGNIFSFLTLLPFFWAQLVAVLLFGMVRIVCVH